MKFADLHLHTFYSDGTYSPQRLIAESKKAGLSAISVADHDTVEGIDPVCQAGIEENIEVLPGIELSAEQDGTEIHILGYLIDHKSKDLKDKLAELKKNRVDRVYKILGKLNEIGVNLNPEAVFDIAKQGTVGRLHIARALLKEGKVSSITGAFQKYIGDDCPAYVLGFKFSPVEAIKFIKDSGGIPVLAHPYIIKDDSLILYFIKSGLMGIEVYYPEHSQGMINFYLDLAISNNLLITGGSDCHGQAKAEAKIGSVKIPYELVEKLKAVKEKLL